MFADTIVRFNLSDKFYAKQAFILVHAKSRVYGNKRFLAYFRLALHRYQIMKLTLHDENGISQKQGIDLLQTVFWRTWFCKILTSSKGNWKGFSDTTVQTPESHK